MRRSRGPSKAFVDTSALIAALVETDRNHERAVLAFQSLFAAHSLLVATNYVVVETAAVLQRRAGLRAARALYDDLVPILDIAWVDEDLHRRGLIAWRSAGRRHLSLIDCVSFELMHELRISHALSYDRHFEEQGFSLLGPIG